VQEQDDIVYYHYTSRLAAQDIISMGLLQLNANGVLFLTPDVYQYGAEAANRLAIEGKPVDVRVEIPAHLVTNPGPTTWVVATARRDGLGKELTVTHPIKVAGLTWTALLWP
jgi:S1-C subfamily serine protease